MALLDLIRQLVDEGKHDLGDEIVKEIASSVSRFIALRMSPDRVNWLANGEGRFQGWRIKLLRLLRVFIKNEGTVWHAANEFVSDFFQHLEHHVKHMDQTVNSPRLMEDMIAVETAGLISDLSTLRTIEQALDELAIDVREQFWGWFISTPRRRSKFVTLVSGLGKEEIKDFVAKHPSRLEELIKVIPDKREEFKFMTLRIAAETDPELIGLVQNDLQLINSVGPDQTIEFWFAVERSVMRGQIKSVDEFKDLMRLPPPEVFRRLNFKLRDKGVREKLSEQFQNTGLVEKSARLRENARRFAGRR